MFKLQTLCVNGLGKFVASSVLTHRAGRAYQIFLDTYDRSFPATLSRDGWKVL
ncbi:hypothetical protein [Microcoleus sp. T3_D1]|uniref:hypothetical protein n=1 Tax=Microcoleus sp. T3_D1 TaxID=3055427 RepID=UPI002FD180B6